jgi:hypothetical protein
VVTVLVVIRQPGSNGRIALAVVAIGAPGGENATLGGQRRKDVAQDVAVSGVVCPHRKGLGQLYAESRRQLLKGEQVSTSRVSFHQNRVEL